MVLKIHFDFHSEMKMNAITWPWLSPLIHNHTVTFWAGPLCDQCYCTVQRAYRPDTSVYPFQGEPFGKMIKELAQQEGVEEDNIVLSLKDQNISAQDTPLAITLSVADIIGEFREFFRVTIWGLWLAGLSGNVNSFLIDIFWLLYKQWSMGPAKNPCVMSHLSVVGNGQTLVWKNDGTVCGMFSNMRRIVCLHTTFMWYIWYRMHNNWQAQTWRKPREHDRYKGTRNGQCIKKDIQGVEGTVNVSNYADLALANSV